VVESQPLPPGWGLCPVLGRIAGHDVPAYPVFMLAAFLAGIGVYFLLLRRPGAGDDRVFYILAAAILGGVIGARIPNWIVYWSRLQVHPEGFLYSGKTILGGLLGGTLAVLLVKRRLGIKVRLGNAIAPAVALGMAIGRLGCLCRGCCYGRPTPRPWGIDLGDGVLRHPTQIYEALFDLLLFFILLWLRRRIKRPGLLFGILLLAYFPFRFLIEFVRSEPRIWPGLTAFQLAAVVGTLFIAWKYVIRPGRERTSTDGGQDNSKPLSAHPSDQEAT
jgi:phosphatidylglycerol---prolipoprotein diacylglyceryl transferase